MENSKQYRHDLAVEIEKAPKEKRKEILEKERKNPEYWQAREEKSHEKQTEEPIDNGMGVFVKYKTLYHGSPVKGIEVFTKAEEDTVGSGVYFTSKAKDAIGYARIRAGNRKEPVIYEASVENMKLLDMRTTEKVKKIMSGFRQKLIEFKARVKPSGIAFIDDAHKKMLDEKIKAIDEDKIDISNIRDVTKSAGEIFSSYVQSLGYDGLITYEGGEGEEVKDHDTYLIFDPEKVKINNVHEIE